MPIFETVTHNLSCSHNIVDLRMLGVFGVVRIMLRKYFRGMYQHALEWNIIFDL
jgi:hypothetical protein